MTDKIILSNCAFSECEKKAKRFIGNNLNDGEIGMCEDCFKKWEQHLTARENMFKEETKKEILEKIDYNLNIAKECFETTKDDKWVHIEVALERLKMEIKE